MEIFSIVDQINVDKLNTKVDEFICRKGYRPYILQIKRRLKHWLNRLNRN